jgi:ParB/RepB/Spo0J family partition protein
MEVSMAGSKRGLGTGAAVQAIVRRRPVEAPDTAAAAPTSIVTALRRPDAAATGGGMQIVPLTDIAEHPDNPRASLGNLTGLAESIATFGVLQPIVVVPADDFLDTHPRHREAVGDRAWVVIAGHRRRAASKVAGRDGIPVMVRADLAGEDLAAAAFVVENVHRENLAPLEEARAYALLADLGIGQREIARRTGVSQSHVSKRLALLRLPQEAQDDLTAGPLTIAEALTLSQAPAADQRNIYELAKRMHWPINSAVSEVARKADEMQAYDEACQQAEHEGLTVVQPDKQWGRAAHSHALYSDTDIDTARQGGTLVAVPTARGLTYYSTEQVRSDGPTNGAGDVDDQERRRANKARAEACGRLVASCPTTQALAADLARTVFRGHVIFADSLRRVHQWLGDQVGDDTTDPHAWHRSLERDGDTIQAWVGWAMAVASDEGHASTAHTRWGPVEAAHLQRLIAGVAYEPTSWEQRRLAAAIVASNDGSHEGTQNTYDDDPGDEPSGTGAEERP